MKRELVLFYIIISIIIILIIIYFALNKKNVNIVDKQKDVEKNDNVVMTIKEGTLTPNSAIVIIKDNSGQHYSHNKWYRIDKKKNKKWEQLNPINPNYIFESIAYNIKNAGKLEYKIDWSNLYGKLEKGEYRLVKKSSDNAYYLVEFKIN